MNSELLLNIIAEFMKVNVDDITGECRKRELVLSRMFYAMNIKCKSLEAKGEGINRDHATVVYYYKNHKNWYKFDKKYTSMYDKFINVLNLANNVNPLGLKIYVNRINFNGLLFN